MGKCHFKRLRTWRRTTNNTRENNGMGSKMTLNSVITIHRFMTCYIYVYNSGLPKLTLLLWENKHRHFTPGLFLTFTIYCNVWEGPNALPVKPDNWANHNDLTPTWLQNGWVCWGICFVLLAESCIEISQIYMNLPILTQYTGIGNRVSGGSWRFTQVCFAFWGSWLNPESLRVLP